MNKRQAFYWILFNFVLTFLFIGLVNETIVEGFSWYWTITAAILIIIVNCSIYFAEDAKGRLDA